MLVVTEQFQQVPFLFFSLLTEADNEIRVVAYQYRYSSFRSNIEMIMAKGPLPI
jgi:hypothetical protein